MRVRGFAELTYRDSARLSFARACERSDLDVSSTHPEAWVVDDRRISFALEDDMTPHDVQRLQRFLEDLGRDASTGEAYLAPDGGDRWTLVVGHVESGIPFPRDSEATPIDDDEADTDVSAIRNGTGS